MDTCMDRVTELENDCEQSVREIHEYLQHLYGINLNDNTSARNYVFGMNRTKGGPRKSEPICVRWGKSEKDRERCKDALRQWYRRAVISSKTVGDPAPKTKERRRKRQNGDRRKSKRRKLVAPIDHPSEEENSSQGVEDDDVEEVDVMTEIRKLPNPKCNSSSRILGAQFLSWLGDQLLGKQRIGRIQEIMPPDVIEALWEASPASVVSTPFVSHNRNTVGKALENKEVDTAEFAREIVSMNVDPERLDQVLKKFMG